ncbi:HigA family addiction module antitoxin [Roseateles sp. 22389]|jgi:addiction module HigA family antidote|uniref:HigA family addiction module antitoxin n=1 Tax=Roseateles sp. 22389 TaxID=3453916 RepID=UPI002627674A|nr:HigA family addiction module antitoxin [uncultured Roseateles sp.]
MSIPRSRLNQVDFTDIATGRRLDPVHPGSILLSEFIEPLGLTRYRVAKAIGVQQRRIDEICAGVRSISADTAVRLGLAFGVDPRFWLNLQAQYDIEVILQTHGDQLVEDIDALAV